MVTSFIFVSGMVTSFVFVYGILNSFMIWYLESLFDMVFQIVICIWYSMSQVRLGPFDHVVILECLQTLEDLTKKVYHAGAGVSR